MPNMPNAIRETNIQQSGMPSDVVSTPEGDNEYAPDEPVGPAEGMQIPMGNAPNPYDADRPAGTKDAADRLDLSQILA